MPAFEKPYEFTLKMPDMELTIVADLDFDFTVLDVEASNCIDGNILQLFTKVRRMDRSGKPREHDGRLVNSKINHDNGTIQMTVEFSDLYLKLWDVAMASATWAVKNRLIVVDLGDDQILEYIISNCTF